MKLTRNDIGKKFVTKGGGIVVIITCSDRQFVSRCTNDINLDHRLLHDVYTHEFHLHDTDGVSIEHDRLGRLIDHLSIAGRFEPVKG